MKTIIRLMLLFGAGLFGLMLLIGLVLSALAEWLLPVLGWERYYTDNLEMALIVALTLLFCLLFGWFIARPGFILQSWLKQLSQGQYVELEGLERIWSPRTGRIRFMYRHYEGMFRKMKDLSEVLKQAEEQRENQDAAQKEWLAGVSHDLKTPLSYIKGYSTMLNSERHNWSPEESSRYLKEIQEKADYMGELISDLNLGFELEHQGVVLKRESVDLAELLRQTLADVMDYPGASGFEFGFEGEAKPVKAHVDARLLGRALRNLLMNAVLHNPPGTVITVGLTLLDKRNVEIRVVDNGKGMDEVTLQDLFRRYSRGTATDVPQGGTGLGMAISKQLITAHGGSIEATSQLGEGTVFSILLPIGYQ